MFALTPISTSNLFSAVQIVVVILGFYFSWKSLDATRKSVQVAGQALTATETSVKIASNNFELGTKNAQAQLFNQMVVQGRDLQYKFMELYYGGVSDDDINKKRDLFMGTLIGYYSSCFELRSVLPLTGNVVKLLDSDLRELLRESQIRDKWEDIKHLYSAEFVRHVDGIRGVV